MKESKVRTGSNIESLTRRGMLVPGQGEAITTDIESTYGKAYGQGVTDIDLASAQAGRQRKGQLLGMIPGLSFGQPEQGPDFGGSLADFISNLTYYYASKGKKKYTGGSYSNMQAPAWGY